MDFQDTQTQDGSAASPTHLQPDGVVPTPAAAVTPTAGAAEQTLTVRFTGSGSEYFRIWIVNLLLIVVTASLYYPFAKARRLRYFHANTWVGDQALGFHGDPWKMLRGYLLMLVFGVAYGAGGYFSSAAAVVAVLAFAALWPALWRASLAFRLANTSWRGLRMRFTGSTADAYKAQLPMLLPVAAFVALTASQPDPEGSALASWEIALLGLAALAFLGLSPMGIAWVKRYQHGHYRYAGEESRLDVRTNAYYGLSFITLVISLVPLGAMLMMTVLVRWLGRTDHGSIAVLLLGLGVLGYYLSLFFVTLPYYASRLQNLVWNATRSEHLRFESRLSCRALVWRTVKNFLLMVVTLGLYRPFAVVHTARLRLEAVQLHASDAIETWVTTTGPGMQDATGDAAGDLLGIDFGL